MAKAEIISITSRRTFLADATLASTAVAAPVAAATSSAEAAPVAANPELTALSEELFEAGDEAAARLDAIRKTFEYIASWEQNNPEPTPAAQSVMRLKRKKLVDAHAAALKRFEAIVDEVCEFAAVTMEDILFKAWMSETGDSHDRKIAGSVVGDLLSLKPSITDASGRV